MATANGQGCLFEGKTKTCGQGPAQGNETRQKAKNALVDGPKTLTLPHNRPSLAQQQEARK